jgi:hypothetical protein
MFVKNSTDPYEAIESLNGYIALFYEKDAKQK